MINNDEQEKLLKCLRKFGEPSWVNAAFDLLKEMLQRYGLNYNHPSLSMSIRDEKGKDFSVNIGSEIVMRITPGRKLHLMLPNGFRCAGCELTGTQFKGDAETTPKWMAVPFEPERGLDPATKDAWFSAVDAQVRNGHKSNRKASNSDLLYRFVTDSNFRVQLVAESFGNKQDQ